MEATPQATQREITLESLALVRAARSDFHLFNELLVQYPREGTWTIAFLTGAPGGDVANHLRGDYLSVYVPTTPNPTSGFFLMLKRSDVVELDMSVDEALKYVISMGVVAPARPALGRPDASP